MWGGRFHRDLVPEPGHHHVAFTRVGIAAHPHDVAVADPGPVHRVAAYAQEVVRGPHDGASECLGVRFVQLHTVLGEDGGTSGDKRSVVKLSGLLCSPRIGVQ